MWGKWSEFNCYCYEFGRDELYTIYNQLRDGNRFDMMKEYDTPLNFIEIEFSAKERVSFKDIDHVEYQMTNYDRRRMIYIIKKELLEKP